MNHPYFTKIRRLLDEAITFDNLDHARALAAKGLLLAQEKECLGELMYFKAQFCIIDEDFNMAIVYLSKAIDANPFDGAAYNDKALCCVSLGRIDGVLELFDQGIAVEADYATIHHNKGWFLNHLGHHQAALECFKQALILEPLRAVTFENMADAYEKIGRKDQALESYLQAFHLIDPSFESIREQILQQIDQLK